MLITIKNWGAIVTLIASVFSGWLPNLRLISQFVLVAAAAVLLIQATNTGRYVWMTLFGVVVCLINPILSTPFSNHILAAGTSLTLFLFFCSSELRQPRLQPSLASIADRTPGSESLWL